MSNEIIIFGKVLGVATVKADGFTAEVSAKGCLVELGNYTFLLKPNQYRNMEVMVELAKEIRRDAGIND